MLYLVTQAHRSEYPQPLEIRQGQALSIGERYQGAEDWDDWHFCSTAEHAGGWVPGQCIEWLSPDRGRAREDYSARELDVDPGEVLQASLQRNGWAWVLRPDSGDCGWVPLHNLQALD